MNSFEMDELSARELQDWLGWREGVDVGDLASALISTLGRVAALEAIVEIQAKTITHLQSVVPQPSKIDPERSGS